MRGPRQENLFRQNAIDALATRFDGRPVAVMPRPWLWLTMICGAFFLAAAYFLWAVDYARKETVRGWIVCVPGVVSLSHSDYAVVTSVAYTAGEAVRRGNPLVVLSDEAMQATRAAISSESNWPEPAAARRSFANSSSRITRRSRIS